MVFLGSDPCWPSISLHWKQLVWTQHASMEMTCWDFQTLISEILQLIIKPIQMTLLHCCWPNAYLELSLQLSKTHPLCRISVPSDQWVSIILSTLQSNQVHTILLVSVNQKHADSWTGMNFKYRSYLINSKKKMICCEIKRGRENN